MTIQEPGTFPPPPPSHSLCTHAKYSICMPCTTNQAEQELHPPLDPDLLAADQNDTSLLRKCRLEFPTPLTYIYYTPPTGSRPVIAAGQNDLRPSFPASVGRRLHLMSNYVFILLLISIYLFIFIYIIFMYLSFIYIYILLKEKKQIN